MAARKISISMDEDLVDELQQAAEEAGMSVSAWIAEQVDHRIKVLGLLKLTDEWQQEHGAFTEEQMAEAHARLDRMGVGDDRPSRRLEGSGA